MVGDFRGLVLAWARRGDALCDIAGAACPYTLPIAGQPLIARVLRSVAAAGASEILVVAGAAIVEDVMAAAGDPGVPVGWSVLPDSEFETTALEVARAELGPGPVLIHLGDSLTSEGFGDGVAEVGKLFLSGGRVLACTLDDLPETADDVTLGMLEGAAERVELEGVWKYDGTVEGVLEANRFALDEIKRGRIGADLSHASVEGRVQIHPSAVLDGAKLRGPVYIGPGAVLSETYVGPYSSIGADVRLEGVEIENSIVLPGAAIRFPGRRLEASIVGEGAQIGRDFSLPSALRLRVGPGADIQLS